MKLPLVCLALVTAAACGSKSKPGVDTPTPTDLAWKDMNADQRHAFMKETVLPTMKAKFVEFDAADFGEMNCKTCHGAGAEDGSFEMPNPDIKPLDFANMDKLDEHEQKVAGWMHDVVVPEMAHLLGEEPYDPATQQGFGCTGCHTVATSK
ncbi:MAG: hypothetical protein IPL61_00555 [Myxococcales bacterium]|nr:hypothetical protein [Myxococcales bacterium]